jgi:hypothetical protein
MKPEKMTRCAGLLAVMMLAGLPSLALARDPGINQPGAYGGTAGVGALPGVGAGRAGAPPAAGGVGGPASGVGVRPGAGAGRAGRRR